MSLPTAGIASQNKVPTESPKPTALNGGYSVKGSNRSLLVIKYRHGWLPYVYPSVNHVVYTKCVCNQTAWDGIGPPAFFYSPLPDGYTEVANLLTGELATTHSSGAFDPFPLSYGATAISSDTEAYATDGSNSWETSLENPNYGQDDLDSINDVISGLSFPASWGNRATYKFDEFLNWPSGIPHDVTQAPYYNHPNFYNHRHLSPSTSFSAYDGSVSLFLTGTAADTMSFWIVNEETVHAVKAQFRTNGHYCLVNGRLDTTFGTPLEPWSLVEEGDGDYEASVVHDIPLPSNVTIDGGDMDDGLFGRCVFKYDGTWEQFQIDHAGETFE